MTKELRIGGFFASKSILLSLVQNSEKMMTGITEYDLTGNKDAMSFKTVEKVCSDRVISCLVNKEEYATKACLELNRHIIRAYIDPDVAPLDRIYSAWYTVWFCRVWKEALKFTREDSSKPKKHDLYEATLKDSFISTNLHVCIELNAHAMLRFMTMCRDLGMPELFLMNLTGSQPCEQMFRCLRSMTTTFNTTVNFDIKEVLEKAKRTQAASAIMLSNPNFEFARQDHKTDMFVPQDLPDDIAINGKVMSAFNDVKKGFLKLSKCIRINLNFQLIYSHIKTILEFVVQSGPPRINLSDLKPTVQKTASLDSDEENLFDEEDLDEVDDDEHFDKNESDESRAFIDNYDELLQMTNGLGNSRSGMKEIHDNDTPKGFLKFLRDDDSFVVRKSTLLWMMATESGKDSSDRLYRFRTDKSLVPSNQSQEKIQAGDFIVMAINNKPAVCRAIGFKYSNAKYKFKSNSCPIKNEEGQGVEVLVQQFNETENNTLKIANKQDCYVKIEAYIRHVNTSRDTKTGKYLIA